MIIVSDASPLIGLARIGLLDILGKLYAEVLIPDAVWQEVVVKGQGLPGATVIGEAHWIQRRHVTNIHLVQALRQELDVGEAEAIALALEVKADLLLMDERLGRETARHFGLQLVGLIGVLIGAKRVGMIDAVRPHMDALRAQAGFRINDKLYKRIMRDQGE